VIHLKRRVFHQRLYHMVCFGKLNT